MGTRAELLADITLLNKQLLGRYLVGFNDVTAVRQTPDLPNHLAWALGHTALTMHRVAASIEGTGAGLPPSDFVNGGGFAGSRDRGVIDADAVAFGSKPEDRHDKYPTLARCTEIFNNACDRLAAAVRECDDARLEQRLTYGSMELPIWALVARMTFHNGFHTGQIADLRRALGFRSIFA
ncbi:MAG TPA: DinB family protein [Phycisphaerales bacterium]|nr:DinB family protein [Phycisphaerales bacterium]